MFFFEELFQRNVFWILKNLISDKKFYFGQKILFLTKNFIFDEKFDF